MPRRKKIVITGKKKPPGTKPKRFTKPNQHGYRLCIPDISKKKPSHELECCDKCGDVNFCKSNIMEYKSPNRPSGLSPKEKSYVICRCQAKSNRYKLLKNKGAQAISENKIFSIDGPCNAIRLALLERGWVEKLPAVRMNLSKIRKGTCNSKPEVLNEVEKLFLSNLVEKYPPSFIWRTKEDCRSTVVDMSNNQDCPTIINRLKADPLWTTKQGLCSSMKRNYWFYIEDVAEVSGPRSYSISDNWEQEGFIKDFKITACTSLLKWVLSMAANERPVFTDTGKISLNVVLFALCRCKEYLYRKENKDIDRIVSNVSSRQWNSFLKKYYRIIGKVDVFENDTDNKLPLYMAYAKFLLEQMHRYRPQLSCEGCHNIWIIKPAHNSRGRGIRLASKLTVINGLLNKASDKYVVQKYIEEPILIHETKFDIRQYCLVTSTYPLVIWMYQDCYLKFSSQKYSLRNYHESIHLTNNAVQRNYTNCAGRHRELPSWNMWDSEQYKEYLNKIDKSKVWDNIIYPGMKKSIVGVMLSCQDTLPVSKNRFELYGCDFILDKEYKPWLIEINSSPDLNHTTPVTANICPAVLTDIIKVVIDYAKDSTSPTGKFECIFRQPMTVPKYSGALDLYVRGIALPRDYFYKGNIDLRETYDSNVEDIIKGNNVKAILDKIKHAFDLDTIMVEPDDDTADCINNGKSSLYSQSDCEINIAASVMIDDLINKVDSEYNSSNPTSRLTDTGYQKSKITVTGFERPDKIPLTSAQSAPVVKTMLTKSLNDYNISIGTITEKESFNFSALDDGPIGKGSIVAVDSRNRQIFKDIKDIFTELKLSDELSSKGYSLSTETMIRATSKLINFINKIEQEYSVEQSLCR